MLLLIARFLLFVVIFIAIVYFLYSISTGDSRKKKAAKDALTRNYQRRFDPDSQKYYLVNVLSDREEPVVNWYGRRIMYKDMVKAEYVLEKMNEE